MKKITSSDVAVSITKNESTVGKVSQESAVIALSAQYICYGLLRVAEAIEGQLHPTTEDKPNAR